MEVGKLIRSKREQVNMSQDELAERIYVSRQTISSWENGKTYPDLRSLLLLSDVFDATVDEIVGKDVERMSKSIEESIKAFKRMGRAMLVSFALMMASVVWLVVQLLAWNWSYIQAAPTMCLVAVFFIGAMISATALEKIKKDNDLLTYHEITSFVKGEEPIRDSEQRKQLIGGMPISQLFVGFVLCLAAGMIFAIVMVAVLALARG